MSGVVSVGLIQALAGIGYLLPEDGMNHARVTRAIKRFQRHAARSYRMPQPDAAGVDLFRGPATGTCDSITAKELFKWVERKWRVPVGRFQLLTIQCGAGIVRLRSDAAAAWQRIVGLADARGATLRGLYGDSARAVRPTSKPGTSRYSFHYCGRAVDIPQEYTGSHNHRYFVSSEPHGGRQLWRIYCKTEKQDGTQGTHFKKGQTTYYSFGELREHPIPAGYYVDLTDLIESTQAFERIKAQEGWSSHYNKAEWWHFQYVLDKEPTFLDEMELIGYSESDLRRAGWTTDAMLDHAPG
jgi:hypothetical protein